MAKRARRRPATRQRASKRRRARTTSSTRHRAPVTAAPPPPPRAETLLLGLARDLSNGPGPGTGDQIGPIVDLLVAAYRPDAPLAAALRNDWLDSRDDKTARLALAWAREQVRLALVDALHRARARTTIDTDTVAWLWLAACEALAHEPDGAVIDRAHALAAFLSPP